MSDPDNPLLAGYKPKARVPVPGEWLFEFYSEKTKKCYRVELRDHGSMA